MDTCYCIISLLCGGGEEKDNFYIPCCHRFVSKLCSLGNKLSHFNTPFSSCSLKPESHKLCCWGRAFGKLILIRKLHSGDEGNEGWYVRYPRLVRVLFVVCLKKYLWCVWEDKHVRVSTSDV